MDVKGYYGFDLLDQGNPKVLDTSGLLMVFGRRLSYEYNSPMCLEDYI